MNELPISRRVTDRRFIAFIVRYWGQFLTLTTIVIALVGYAASKRIVDIVKNEISSSIMTVEQSDAITVVVNKSPVIIEMKTTLGQIQRDQNEMNGKLDRLLERR